MSRGAFIGPLGSLVEIAHYKGSVSSKADRAVGFKSTLGGGRVAFLSPNLGLREWSVSSDLLSPVEFAAFEQMVAFGDGPFAFLDPLAQHTNTLTPLASLFRAGVSGGTVSGAFTGSDGARFPVSLIASTGNVYFGSGTPVLPGVTVTGSAYATAGTRLVLHFLDAGGVATSITAVTAAENMGRASITAVAPAEAVSVRLGVSAGSGAGTVAGPAITWTPSVVPWSVGRGALKTVVSGVSDGVVLASKSQQYKSLSFTVTEVGAGA